MAGSLDASTLRRSMDLFAEALRQHREEIDSLNVFPVPDGDTGTNILLTQEAVVSELAKLDGRAGLRTLGEAISRASLMGARGNSGVILSQVLRGLCERLSDDGLVGPRELSGAIDHASREADRAVASPREGTVLSVLRDAAEAAAEAAGDGAGLPDVVEAALERARRSLALTRDVLPELRRAGVVDAGGKGLVLLLDALKAALAGAALTEPVGPLGPVGASSTAGAEPDQDFGFEVQYLLEADEAAVGPLREALAGIGDSLVVVGGGGLFNVHVHTDSPDRAVALGQEAGRPREPSVVSLTDRVTACIAGQARAVRVAEQASALVAVAQGEGIEEAFRSLGAVVVRGGPGSNPSVEELAEAIEAAPAGDVLMLPNHPNIVPAAQRAAAASSKRVRVVPASSVPAGLSAGAAFHPLADLATNGAALEEAAEAVRAGEVARAEREAGSDAGPVRPGDWVGISEGRVVCVGDGPVRVAADLTALLMAGGEAEIVTVVAGADPDEDEVAELADILREAFTGMDVQIVRGGQPRFRYLVGVE